MGDIDGLGDGPAVGPALGLCDGDAEGAGVAHVPSSLHRPLAQSRGPSPISHFSPGGHGGHAPPPQSTDVSRPFSISSRHEAGVGESEGDGDDGISVGD